MHLEVLTEDSSGAKLLQAVLPKLLGEPGVRHTWRIHSYKGVGRLPKDLGKSGNPTKRILLDQLPRLLRGYSKTPGIDLVVVVLDSDQNDCRQFLAELQSVVKECAPTQQTLIRLAIEEIEAWYFGDAQALIGAYPKAKQEVLERYNQDAICGTWEKLADAIYPGGSSAITAAGWPLPGQIKHKWAEDIGPLMDVDRNVSPSFCKLRDGIRRRAT